MSRSNSSARKEEDSLFRTSLRVDYKKNNPLSKNPILHFLLIVLVAGGACWSFHIYAGKKSISSPIVIDEQGGETLAPERRAKLDKELDELENAEQYALIANLDGYYPCYTCPNGATTIYLYKGEVWKYGATRKGEEKRYPGKSYGAPNLSFIVQFQGNFGECLKMEKIKIYNYPLLPEAKKRSIRLFRPPGNSNDS